MCHYSHILKQYGKESQDSPWGHLKYIFNSTMERWDRRQLPRAHTSIKRCRKGRCFEKKLKSPNDIEFIMNGFGFARYYYNKTRFKNNLKWMGLFFVIRSWSAGVQASNNVGTAFGWCQFPGMQHYLLKHYFQRLVEAKLYNLKCISRLLKWDIINRMQNK